MKDDSLLARRARAASRDPRRAFSSSPSRTVRLLTSLALVSAGAALVALSGGDASAQPAPGDAGAPKPAASAAAAPKDAGATPTTAGDAGASAPSSSAAPSGSGYVPPPAPSARKVAPPPPPPSKEQIIALQALKEEMDAYEKGAKDYKDTVTNIIKLHYEAKKREILSGLDREIGIEKAELKKARETAIKRLEEFIQIYSGTRAHPEATPDAMYRLAALYEERARSDDTTEPVEIGLKPAIALYKRVITEFPQYRELAGIYYFLGHAYVDSGRTDEGQQVWRSLVCHNKFPYPTPPDAKRPERDSITPLPQDHDEAFWTAWRKKYDDPKKVKRGNPDTTYVDPYPSDCQFVAQPGLRPGDEPKYVAEVWWQIGNWEFDQLDVASGVTKEDPGSVWGYNRAASAYQQSMKFKKPPLYGVALYKYSWTLFKQQRYELATKQFVALLLYTDEQQKLTGDPGADFRNEAYTYIAGSLTNVDFAGPAADEPFIQRPDIIDTESRPEVAEKKLHVAIDRVKDPNLIPQDKPWTIEIYRALAGEYRSMNEYSNALEVYELMLKKWPMDPTAPEVQNSIAETYDQILLGKKQGTPEHDQISQKALEARTALANYIGNTPWVDANKDNPAAIQNAERLVRGGLRQAAAQHTNNGKQALVAANDTSDPGRQLELVNRAANEYKLAAIGWQGYLKQDENAPDAYESRYWLADARRQAVRIQLKLHQIAPLKFPEPSRRDIDDAYTAAVDVRDSNEDDKFLDNAAFFVVDVADVDRDLQYVHYEESKGSSGIPERKEVKFEGEGNEKKVVKDPVPDVVMRSIQARDDYVQRVPPNLDTEKNGIKYQYYSAEVYFLYGQFEQARARFVPMMKEHCTSDEYGYRAWEKLITMSNLEGNAEQSRALAEQQKTKPCCSSPELCAKGGVIINPTLQEAAYVDARKKFEAAKAAPPGPERDKLWREAAGLYEAALQAAPSRDEAPEAAMNAAYAYKQVGEYNKAIELYNKFINEYGNDQLLNRLQKGGPDPKDPKAKVAPDPKRYEQRVKFLGDAYDALATTYYGFFNYQRAAETYEKVAGNERFPADSRKLASKNAMTLFAAMGQRDKMMAEYKIFLKLGPSAEEKANADYLVANYDYNQWSPQSPDTGQNRQYRFAAQQTLIAYFQANRNTRGAQKYLVEAAHSVAIMMKVGGDPAYRTWFKSTIQAWEALKATPPAPNAKNEALGPPYADYAAEADFTLLDEQIRAAYDTDARHKYTGSVDDVLGELDLQKKTSKDGKYQNNAKEADKWDKELDRITKTYPSVEWVPTAIARRGELYDRLRTGLYNAVPPAIKFFTPAQENLLRTMRNSGRDDLMDKADELDTAKREYWRNKKEKELGGADEVMVRHYATAIALARKYNVRNTQMQKAVGRMAYFTDIIGDAKLKDYVTKTKDPNEPSRQLDYKDGQYVQTRPGLTGVPASNGSSVPLPAAP